MTWYQIAAVAVSTLVALVVWRKVQGWRETKRFYADLRAMNREKIDRPEWVKQPWQHEPGEGKQQRLVEEAKIEAYAASKHELDRANLLSDQAERPGPAK